MKDFVFNAVKKAYEGVLFEIATDEAVSQFHHHLDSLLDEELLAGNIGYYAISNVNLLENKGLFVRVSVMKDDAWNHYEFSCKIDSCEEVIEGISSITVKEV